MMYSGTGILTDFVLDKNTINSYVYSTFGCLIAYTRNVRRSVII